MNRLSSLFVEERFAGCTGTPVTSTYEMRFELQDNEMRIHPIACMDMAGELFTCAPHNTDAGEQLREDQQQARTHSTISCSITDRATRRDPFLCHRIWCRGSQIQRFCHRMNYLNSAAMHLAAKGVFRDQDRCHPYPYHENRQGKMWRLNAEQHLKEYMAKELSWIL